MEKKILLTEPIRPAGLEILQKDADVVVAPEPTPEAVASMIADFDGLISRNTFIGKEIFDRAPKLKVVATHGAGTDHIDVIEASKKGVYIVNTPGANAESVAEAVVGLMLSLSRKLFDGAVALKFTKDYYYRNRCIGMDLHKKTIGIIGMGQIGQKLARICNKGFNMSVLGYDPYVSEVHMAELGANKVIDLNKLLENADFVSLNCPYYDELYHLIDEKKFNKMKKTAYIVNCARGLLIDEKALCDALKNHEIAGAALDVFNEEPLRKDDPLYALPNLIMTPHIAAFAQDSIDNMSLISATDVLSVLNGDLEKAHIVNYRDIQR